MYSDRYAPPPYRHRESFGRGQDFHGKDGRHAEPLRRGFGKAVLRGKSFNNGHYNPTFDQSYQQKLHYQQPSNKRVSKSFRRNTNNNNMRSHRQQQPSRFDDAAVRQYFHYSPAAEGYRLQQSRKAGSKWVHAHTNRRGRHATRQDRVRKERRQRSLSYQPSIASSLAYTPKPQPSPLRNSVTPSSSSPSTSTTPDLTLQRTPPTSSSSTPSHIYEYYDTIPNLNILEMEDFKQRFGLSTHGYSSFVDYLDSGVDEPYVPPAWEGEEDDIALDDDIDAAFEELGIEPEEEDGEDFWDDGGIDLGERVEGLSGDLGEMFKGFDGLKLVA